MDEHKDGKAVEVANQAIWATNPTPLRTTQKLETDERPSLLLRFAQLGTLRALYFFTVIPPADIRVLPNVDGHSFPCTIEITGLGNRFPLCCVVVLSRATFRSPVLVQLLLKGLYSLELLRAVWSGHCSRSHWNRQILLLGAGPFLLRDGPRLPHPSLPIRPTQGP
jgi:hypothetical protein